MSRRYLHVIKEDVNIKLGQECVRENLIYRKSGEHLEQLGPYKSGSPWALLQTHSGVSGSQLQKHPLEMWFPGEPCAQHREQTPASEFPPPCHKQTFQNKIVGLNQFLVEDAATL